MNIKQEKWHVGKEIPIAVIVTLMAQTGGWIWWAATQTAKLDNLVVMMSEYKRDQYTKTEAAKDMQFMLSRISNTERRIDHLETTSAKER